MSVDPIISWIAMVIVTVGVCVAIGIAALRTRPNRRRIWWSRWLMILVVVVMAWRPQLYTGTYQSLVTNLDIYFVVDVTASSAAEDFDGKKTRLEGMKNDIATIANALPGAQFSLISFANSTTLDLPLISDTSAVISITQTLQPVSYLYAKGSNIAEPVKLVEQQLQAEAKAHPERQQVVYYLGDGEQVGGNTSVDSFSPLKPYLYTSTVLGYGTSDGGRMQDVGYHIIKTKDDGFKNYILDYTGQRTEYALSRINEKNLQTIADQMGGRYLHRTNNGDVELLTQSIDKNRQVRVGSKDGIPATFDFYWLFAIIAWVLLMRDFREQYMATVMAKSQRQSRSSQ